MEHTLPPKIGDYIINPSTGRTVKVGSKVWIKLVKSNIVSGDCVDEHVIDDIEDDCSQGELDEKLTQIKSQLPAGITATRGKGKYAGKIVTRNKQVKIQDVAKQTAKVATKIISDNEGELDEDELEKMIMNELMIGKPKCSSLRSQTGEPKIVKQTQKKSANYQTKEITDCSQSESEDTFD